MKTIQTIAHSLGFVVASEIRTKAQCNKVNGQLSVYPKIPVTDGVHSPHLQIQNSVWNALYEQKVTRLKFATWFLRKMKLEEDPHFLRTHGQIMSVVGSYVYCISFQLVAPYKVHKFDAGLTVPFGFLLCLFFYTNMMEISHATYSKILWTWCHNVVDSSTPLKVMLENIMLYMPFGWLRIGVSSRFTDIYYTDLQEWLINNCLMTTSGNISAATQSGHPV